MGLLAKLHLQPPANWAGAAGAAPGGVAAPPGNATARGAGADEKSLIPGISADVLRKAAKDMSEALTEIVFEPQVQVLTPVPAYTIPIVIGLGEERTIDLTVQNWAEEAPDALTNEWSIQVSDKAVTARIQADASPQTAYLTVTGAALYKTATITVISTLRLPGSKPKISVLRQFNFYCGTELPVDPRIEQARSTEGGGLVTQSQLEQDMTDLLQDWLQAASTGIGQFATSQIETKLNKLSEVDKRTFFLSLLGNVVWAATVFNVGGSKVLQFVAKALPKGGDPNRPQQVVTFVISMAGIVGPAVDSYARAGAAANSIDEVRTAMDDANQQWYQYMQTILVGQIKGMADKVASTTRYEATSKVSAAVFKPGTVHTDPKGQLKPTINLAVVSARYRTIATFMLDKMVAQASKDVLTKAFDAEDQKGIKANKAPRKM